MDTKMKKQLIGLIVILSISFTLFFSCDLNNQDPYVKILDVSPDTNLVEETIDITVKLEYFVNSTFYNTIRIGFNNTDDPYLLVPYDEVGFAAPKHGTYSNTYNLLPKKHLNKDFQVTVFISGPAIGKIIDSDSKVLTFQ
jgi:hypothetical protein